MRKIFLFLVALFAMNAMATEGALNGVFSVSADKKVVFSQGNLQYNAGNGETHATATGTAQGTWRFAARQYDIIGADNDNIAEDYNGYIDLFGWGTSGYNGVNPWLNSTNDLDYGNPDPDNTRKSDIAGTNYDWGVFNAIYNGGDEPGLWRTLTAAEWQYIVAGRENAAKLISKASIGSTTGILLLPDDWDFETLPLTATLSDYTTVTIDVLSWTKWEDAGAVFLPSAGTRNANAGGYSSDGITYATSSFDSSYETYRMNKTFDAFYTSANMIGVTDYQIGLSVRLVKDAIYKVTIAENEDITVTGCKDNNGNDVDLNAVPGGLEYIDIFFTCAEGTNVEFIDGVDDEEWLEFDNSHVRLKVGRDIELEITTFPIFYSVNLRAEDYSMLLPAPQREGERKAPMRFGGGSIIAYLSGTTDEPDNLDLVPHGTKLDIIAQPELGWMFVEWDRIASTSNRLTVTITSDTTITAYFKEAATYTLTMQDDGNGVVTIFNGTPGEEVYYADPIPVFEGTELYLTAHPNSGYEFDHWDNYSAPVWDEEAEDWIAPTMTGDLTVKAYFRPKGAQPELAEGELPGLFTVGKDGEGNPIRVRFSKGNLQYIAGDDKTHATAEGEEAQGTWLFAESQEEYIGSNNSRAAEDYDKPIDLFNYGTSGYEGRQPWLQETDTLGFDISETNYDWGVYNAISNGGNQPGMWRTLKQEEWSTLLYNRCSGTTPIYYGRMLQGLGKVMGEAGLLLMPDGWVMPGELAKENITFLPLAVENFTTNKYTAAQWAILEQSGVVFLPAGGVRIYADGFAEIMMVGSHGALFSSTIIEGTRNSLNIIFGTPFVEFEGGTEIVAAPTGGDHEVNACSVRLVRNEPTVPEGIEQPTSDSSLKERGQKVLRNGQLFILRDGKTYNALGMEIK